jgi:hypothetical protein
MTKYTGALKVDKEGYVRAMYNLPIGMNRQARKKLTAHPWERANRVRKMPVVRRVPVVRSSERMHSPWGFRIRRRR